jgi:SAM-dependent methyltransferase
MTAIKRLRRFFIYAPADPVSFWSPRAADPGWLSVMWANPAYNELAHLDQWEAIERNLPDQRGAVLDLGCGTGRLSAPLAGLFEKYVGVDLDTMVTEARRRNPDLTAEFVAAGVQDYDYPVESFDLVLSMACLASACCAGELPEIAERMVEATRAGGRIIMIDPFHILPALTRTCRLNPRQVIEIFTALGMTVEEWSGVHFIPGRLLLARSWFSRCYRFTRISYRIGETIGKLAPRLLSDYSIIALKK